MYRFPRQACHAVNIASRKEVTLDPRFVAWLQARHSRVVAQGVAFHEAQPPPEPPDRAQFAPAPNRKDDVLRFLTDPSVPFTNNLAERDLRMMKVRQKISGCFRTAAGAENLATLRTVLSTARKQGWNLIGRTCYCTDGRLEISNNAAENAVRPISLGRKNRLFPGSDAGGERAAIFYTLIRSAK